MIAQSHRVVPLFLISFRGDEVRSSYTQSGSTAPTIVWGDKAEPPVSQAARRLCCKRAHGMLPLEIDNDGPDAARFLRDFHRAYVGGVSGSVAGLTKAYQSGNLDPLNIFDPR